MRTISSLLIFIGFMCAGTVAMAQSSGCDFDSGFDEFNFWVGEWTVYDNASGNLAGMNSISKEEQGCLILENWTSSAGGTGTSMNYYNPLNRQWRQLWVSAGRYAIDIAGGLSNDSMVMSGRIYYFTGSEEQFRGTWSVADDASVRQLFEQYNSDTQEWDVWFDGRYVRN